MPRILCLAIAVLLAAVPPARAQGADPFLGTWRLNLEKSQFPGPPPAQPHVLTFEAASDGTILGLVHDLDASGGRTAVARLNYRYDGREYRDLDPVTGAAKSNTLAFTRIDGRTVEVVHRIGGAGVSYREIRRVSEDGRTLTFSATLPRRGGTVTVLQVFDRQDVGR
jgi:hypothetical protein